MTVVRTLDTDTIERIAAGEVVTRPANVVTELVENALDAAATRISITVENGGLDRIQVSDDGHGMDEADAALAVERHTTSKIEDASDVDSVETLGFRGEALPSIAAVARLELTTKPSGSVGGTRVTVDEDKTVEPAGHGVGTTVEVTELFARLPARRAALGSSTQEFSHISRAVSRYALCHPDVRFRLVHDGNTVLSTPGTGRTDAILSVYDRSVAGQSTEFASEHETNEGVLRVEGSLVYPAVTRSKPTHVYTAVNGRALSETTIRNATIAGYGSLLASDRYPIAVVGVTLPPECVDVNVHPAKESVRFTDEQRVATAVERAVSETLSGTDLSRSAEFSFDDSSIDTERPATFEDVAVIGQFRELYLLCEDGDDLLVLDQHAAHERITYERLRERAGETIESVALDPPQTLSLTPTEATTVEEHHDAIEALGFHVEPFGNTTYRVTELPAPLGRVTDGDAVHDVLDAFLAGEEPEDPRDALLAELACHPSLRAGDTVSTEEAATLIEQLGACEQPYACPHGRPTVLSIDEATLARSFERSDIRFE